MDEQQTNFNQTMETVGQAVNASMSALPAPLRLLVQPLIQRNLQTLANQLKIPCLALYGRAGAGKSSIVNAIVGWQAARTGVARSMTSEHESYSYARDGWELRFVDSRGLADQANDEAFQQALDFMTHQCVDVLLFVIPADERSYVAHDIRFLTALKSLHMKRWGRDLPIIVVINKIDRVAPPGEWQPPYKLDLSSSAPMPIGSAHEQKEANILECLRARRDEYKGLTTRFIPVSAAWDTHTDRRYNIDALAEDIFKCLPAGAKPGFAAASTLISIKQSVSKTLSFSSAILVGSACLIPVPFLDSAMIAIIQTTLVAMIARLGANNEDKQRVATRFIRNLGVYSLGIAAPSLIAQVKYVFAPAAVPAAATAAASTYALGQAAAAHFIEGVSEGEAQNILLRENKRWQQHFMQGFSSRNRRKVAENIRKLGRDEGVDDTDFDE